MPSRKITDLVPAMQEKYHLFEDAMAANNMPFRAEKGIGFFVTQTLRTVQEQEAYYAQGRRVLEIVNNLRDKAGLAPIIENGNKIVTHTIHSKHLEGKAFDIAMLLHGKVAWSNYLFDKAGPVGESGGLEWGGRWARKDRPHFQLREG